MTARRTKPLPAPQVVRKAILDSGLPIVQVNRRAKRVRLNLGLGLGVI
jgi:hypothetical protein